MRACAMRLVPPRLVDERPTSLRRWLRSQGMAAGESGRVARSRVMTALARWLLATISRNASRTASSSGVARPSQRSPTSALVMMAASGWFSSCAIEVSRAPSGDGGPVASASLRLGMLACHALGWQGTLGEHRLGR